MMQREDNNTINRAVFTWLSKRIGFGFGFGFTTPFGWLEYLLWFWFYDSQVKTALIGTEVNMHQFKCLLNTVVDPGKGPKPSLNIFRPKWWPKKKKKNYYETAFAEHKVTTSSTAISSRFGSTTEQFNICLWCKMLDAESHLNAMLREVANQKNKLFKHDAGWKCLII